MRNFQEGGTPLPATDRDFRKALAACDGCTSRFHQYPDLRKLPLRIVAQDRSFIAMVGKLEADWSYFSLTSLEAKNPRECAKPGPREVANIDKEIMDLPAQPMPSEPGHRTQELNGALPIITTLRAFHLRAVQEIDEHQVSRLAIQHSEGISTGQPVGILMARSKPVEIALGATIGLSLVQASTEMISRRAL